MRVARNGREYRRAWERQLDSRQRPTKPAAVRVYDQSGMTRCVVFDLDAKRGQRAAVLRDSQRLAAWLGEAGCAYFIDESPNGGRHVYVPLAEPLPLAEVAPILKGLRASKVLPTLDPSPMANITEGCIRPPGAEHRNGGHQRLITELHKAAATLIERTTPGSWAALTRLLPVPEVAAPDLRALMHAVPDQGSKTGPVTAQALLPYFNSIATTARYDQARYGSPSEARAAVLLHAMARGWTDTEITRQVSAGARGPSGAGWPGLATLYRDKYGRYADKALEGDLRRARQHLADHPLTVASVHKSHTSATRPRAGMDSAATRLHLRRFTAAISIAVAERRWNPRASYGRENVLLALASAARQVQSAQVEHGTRHLSFTGGTVLDWATVAAHLRALREEDDPFVLLLDADRGAGADVYELVIPAAYVDRLPPDAELPELPRGIHPVFGKLSVAAYRVFTALDAAKGPVKAAELAEAAHAPARTVWAVLAELEAHQLAVRGSGGAWRTGRRSLDRVARDLGVGRRLRDLVRTWRLERDAWRITLGLSPREQPPSRSVVWPGRPAAEVAPRRQTAPQQPPAAAPAAFDREAELLAIGGGQPDWRVDLEEATAILLLQHTLGAQLISPDRSRSVGGGATGTAGASP